MKKVNQIWTTDNWQYLDVSKNRGKTTKMDGLFHGKPYCLIDDLGGPPLFLETPICQMDWQFFSGTTWRLHRVWSFGLWFWCHGSRNGLGRHVSSVIFFKTLEVFGVCSGWMMVENLERRVYVNSKLSIVAWFLFIMEVLDGSNIGREKKQGS